jgi:hypothetical protein
MQYRGRQMHTWSEIVYDGRGYRISLEREDAQHYLVKDQSGEIMLTLLHNSSFEINLTRPLPVQFIILVVLRIMEENQVIGK